MDNREKELVKLASNVLNNEKYKNTANMITEAKKAKLSVECDMDIIQQLRDLVRRILENGEPEIFFHTCLCVFASIYIENFENKEDEDENENIEKVN